MSSLGDYLKLKTKIDEVNEIFSQIAKYPKQFSASQDDHDYCSIVLDFRKMGIFDEWSDKEFARLNKQLVDNIVSSLFSPEILSSFMEMIIENNNKNLEQARLNASSELTEVLGKDKIKEIMKEIMKESI